MSDKEPDTNPDPEKGPDEKPEKLDLDRELLSRNVVFTNIPFGENPEAGLKLLDRLIAIGDDAEERMERYRREEMRKAAQKQKPRRPGWPPED